MLKLSINTGKRNLTSPEYLNTETDVSNNENACFGLIVASCLAKYQEIWEGGQRQSRMLSNAMNAGLQEVYVHLNLS